METRSTEPIESIQKQLLGGAGGLARSARRVYRWRAVAWWGTVVLSLLLGLMLVDMLVRREEVGLRFLTWLVWLGMAGAAAFKLLRPAWRFAPTSLEIAQWLEQRRPELGNRLSTAVELAALPAGSDRFGSQGFRESALRRWQAEAGYPDWRQHLELNGLWKAMAALAVASVLLTVLAAGWPSESRLAFTRLAIPWSAHHWPRADRLAFQNLPSVVALGSGLQLEIVDQNPPLPDGIEVQLRPVGDPKQSDAAPATVTRLSATRVGDLAVANLPPLEQAVEVRAVGGDDATMAWQPIAVARPPELQDYRFQIQPPAYAQQPSRDLVGRRIRVLAGSQVAFAGKFNGPVTAVTVQPLQVDQPPAGEPAATESLPPPWVAQLAADGQGLTLGQPSGEASTFHASLSWQFLISTEDGLEVLQPEPWSIDVTPDTSPVVSLKTAELAQLSAAAQLPLVGEATDDLGLVEVYAQLQIEGAQATEPRRFPIWSADTANPDASPTRQLSIDSSWDFSKEVPLVSGQRISLWLEARDTLGQIGKSPLQNFEIRDPDDLLVSIQNRQNQILQRVRELVDNQRRNEQLAARTGALVRSTDKIGREQLDVLRGVAQVQRAIGKQLSDEPNSIAREVATMQQLLLQNRLDESELAAELEFLGSEVKRLAEQPIAKATATAEAASEQAAASLEDSGTVQTALTDSLSASSTAQVDAVRGLEELLDRLARNESLQQIQRELAQILNQQNGLRRETDQLQLERLSNTNREELQARQAGLSADQQGLARRLDALTQRAAELRQAASQDQQSLKTQIERATQTLLEQQASAKMRRSTEEIRAEQFAQATATQQQVAELLNDALRELGAGNRSQLGSLQSRAEAMRAAGKTIGELADSQSAVAEQMKTPEGAAEAELSGNQAEVRESTEQQAQQAAERGDGTLATQLEETTRQQRQAEQRAAQGDLSQAAEAAQSAAEQLRQSAEQLEQRAETLEREVRQQQMFQLDAAVSELVAQQSPVAAQFQQLASRAIDEQNRETTQTEIRQIAARQEAVRQLLRDVRLETSQLPTFDWTLAQTETAMLRAIAAAQRYRVEPDARQAADEALRMLELAATAMQRSPSGEEQPPTDTDPPANEAEAEQPPRMVPALASLKLLRALQWDVNQQTQALRQDPPGASQTQRLNELSAMQQALGTQLEQLLRELSAAQAEGDDDESNPR